MKKKYKVILNCTLTFEVDALSEKHAYEYTKFLASVNAKKIEVINQSAEVIGDATKYLEDLS
jgi:hypothetical protein